jgi:hypothetical protein
MLNYQAGSRTKKNNQIPHRNGHMNVAFAWRKIACQAAMQPFEHQRKNKHQRNEGEINVQGPCWSLPLVEQVEVVEAVNVDCHLVRRLHGARRRPDRRRRIGPAAGGDAHPATNANAGEIALPLSADRAVCGRGQPLYALISGLS